MHTRMFISHNYNDNNLSTIISLKVINITFCIIIIIFLIIKINYYY